jgi:hypothetical protein
MELQVIHMILHKRPEVPQAALNLCDLTGVLGQPNSQITEVLEFKSSVAGDNKPALSPCVSCS